MVDDAYCAALLPALASYGDKERSAFNGSETSIAEQKQNNRKVHKQGRNRSAEQQWKQRADCGYMAMLKGWSCLGGCTQATSGCAFRQRKGLLQMPTSV